MSYLTPHLYDLANLFPLLPKVVRDQLNPNTIVRSESSIWRYRDIIATWPPGTWSQHQDLERAVAERKRNTIWPLQIRKSASEVLPRVPEYIHVDKIVSPRAARAAKRARHFNEEEPCAKRVRCNETDIASPTHAPAVEQLELSSTDRNLRISPTFPAHSGASSCTSSSIVPKKTLVVRLSVDSNKLSAILSTSLPSSEAATIDTLQHDEDSFEDDEEDGATTQATTIHESDFEGQDDAFPTASESRDVTSNITSSTRQVPASITTSETDDNHTNDLGATSPFIPGPFPPNLLTLTDRLPFYSGDPTTTLRPPYATHTPHAHPTPSQVLDAPYNLHVPEPHRLILTLPYTNKAHQIWTYYYRSVPDWSSRKSVKAISRWRNQIRNRASNGVRLLRKAVVPFTEIEREVVQRLFYRDGFRGEGLRRAFCREMGGDNSGGGGGGGGGGDDRVQGRSVDSLTTEARRTRGKRMGR